MRSLTEYDDAFPGYKRVRQFGLCGRACFFFFTLSAMIALSVSAPPIANADSSTPSIAFTDSTIRIPSATGPAKVIGVLIKGENLDNSGADANTNLEWQDLSFEATSKLVVKLLNIRRLGPTGKSQTWLADIEISNFPSDSSVKRRMLFTYGKAIASCEFTITNRLETAFTWSVKPGVKEMLLGKSRELALAISTGDSAATNVHIGLSSLQDESTKDSIGREYLNLCVQRDGSCDEQPFWIPRHSSSQPVKLTIDEKFSRPGVYKGTVWVAVDQKQDPEPVEITVYSTKVCWEILGALLISLGVLLWWLVSVYARQKVARAEALIPVAELRETVSDLARQVTQLEKSSSCLMPQIQGQLAAIVKKLDPDKSAELNDVLPAEFPGLSGVAGDSATALKQYIDPLGAQVSGLSVLVNQGGSAILSKLTQATEVGKQDLICKSLQDLDAAAPTVKSIDDARGKSKEVVDALAAALAPAREQDVAPIQNQSYNLKDFLPSSKELRLESKRLAISVWAAWGVVTVLAGISALILSNPGFGTVSDYFKCFFWGLSIQAAGQQLQQLTPSSVMTSLKIPVAK